jgi:hypothetical protein
LSDQPIDKVISCLNEAFAADPLAMRLLLINRVQCNRSLADHPTIVCDDCARRARFWTEFEPSFGP